jgi:hypothetical protein
MANKAKLCIALYNVGNFCGAVATVIGVVSFAFLVFVPDLLPAERDSAQVGMGVMVILLVLAGIFYSAASALSPTLSELRATKSHSVGSPRQ